MGTGAADMGGTPESIIAHLPYLRRHARLLTGSQAIGDEFVRLCLELVVAEPQWLEGDDLRVQLFRAFHAAWAKVHETIADDQHVRRRRARRAGPAGARGPAGNRAPDHRADRGRGVHLRGDRLHPRHDPRPGPAVGGQGPQRADEQGLGVGADHRGRADRRQRHRAHRRGDGPPGRRHREPSGRGGRARRAAQARPGAGRHPARGRWRRHRRRAVDPRSPSACRSCSSPATPSVC